MLQSTPAILFRQGTPLSRLATFAPHGWHARSIAAIQRVTPQYVSVIRVTVRSCPRDGMGLQEDQSARGWT